jgi:glycosyltransferase involved in cell wall biosynthesis
LSDAQLKRLIQGGVALAMLSHYEGYGLPIAQAFSLGTPVITTLGSSLPEACSGEGIFVEPSDPFSVSAGIWAALKTHQKPTERLKKWTWENYARNLLDMLTQH